MEQLFFKQPGAVLVNSIYGPFGVANRKIVCQPSSWWRHVVKVTKVPFLVFRQFARMLWYYTYYSLRCHIHWKHNKDELVNQHGMVCFNLAPCQANTDVATSTENHEPRITCLTVFQEFVSGAIGNSNNSSPELELPLMTYVRIPRDILFIYQDQDTNILRKVELRHNIRIFQGRDFERGRDRDRPSAPRGTARLCLYGRYPHIMSARKELFGWLEHQADFKEEEILVPEYATGNVIGRQGARVAKMQIDSKARIDVQTRDDRQRNPSDDVKILVSGRKPARDAARRLLNECVEHSERMRERDRIKDSIRDVRRRIMYGEEDNEHDAEFKRSESQSAPSDNAQFERPQSYNAEFERPQPKSVLSALAFKPRCVELAEARSQITNAKIATQWGAMPPKAEGVLPAVDKWGQGFSTWADASPAVETAETSKQNTW